MEHAPITTEPAPDPRHPVQELESVVIRLAGDSGDGMQLVGDEFSKAVASAGNAFITRPDFPSEIRAPVGTLFGVSGYQIQYSSRDVFTSGDAPDVLVVMNPAALKVNLADLKPGGMIIANSSGFTRANLERAGYADNPLTDGTLGSYRLFAIDIGGLTSRAVAGAGLSKKESGRCKNYFALGLLLWLYHRPVETEIADIERRFREEPALAQANVAALRAGHAYGETSELFTATFEVRPAPIRPGRYRSVTGNQALALGFAAASELSGVRLFLGSYPITPASDILQALAAMRHFNIVTFQAEDEIAGICSAVGAAFGGALGLTATSGPGMALKTEAIGLAVMTELPVVIVNVQRAGPSTGMPTKIEQADLLQAMFGRHGEAPAAVIAARSPADCFDCAVEAFRIAVTYMTPVILLSDGGIANSAEPWRIPDIGALPPLEVHFRTDPEGYHVYERDEHLARAWVRPGTPGMEHRIGGLEKDALTGDLSGDPLNHQRMVEARAAKIAGIARDLPPLEVHGASEGDLLVVGWGSTHGAIEQAVTQSHAAGAQVGHVHLRYLNPLPRDLEGILRRFGKVLVPELNLGQLVRLLRDRYLVDAIPLNKVQGRPFKVAEVYRRIQELVP
ncbi:MAG TPA: 2-oxoacid:acceptor oxidoreductase subunit alpha [Gemmatimonadales bacterium]|nr:2-oxoacid:acceptor oxidoreductase subunit alpha [Gemmatimonadales bacterium]